MNLKKILSELFGWYGTIAIISSYFLLSFNFIASNNFIYQFLNLTGAIAIVYISLIKKAYQPAVLNMIWALIAFISLIKIFF